MDRLSLKSDLLHYKTPYATEAAFIERFLQLLEDRSNPYTRDRLHGHLTASAWVVDPAREQAVLILHKKLDRWLQPGGHADGEENLIAVARKEVEEETGLKDLKLVSEGIFDIDIHAIPANKKDPEHDHYDIRFIFEADPNSPFLANHEVKQVAWKPLSWINENLKSQESIIRLVQKTSAVA